MKKIGLIHEEESYAVRGLIYEISYDFIRMKTFLKSLELRFGLIINFSKRQLQIYGVNPS
jgi:hypothetical protein